jgi:hypothetical protein
MKFFFGLLIFFSPFLCFGQKPTALSKEDTAVYATQTHQFNKQKLEELQKAFISKKLHSDSLFLNDLTSLPLPAHLTANWIFGSHVKLAKAHCVLGEFEKALSHFQHAEPFVASITNIGNVSKEELLQNLEEARIYASSHTIYPPK